MLDKCVFVLIAGHVLLSATASRFDNNYFSYKTTIVIDHIFLSLSSHLFSLYGFPSTVCETKIQFFSHLSLVTASSNPGS